MDKCKTFASNMFRKKTLSEDLMSTQLKRCLTLVDLILFGLGHMIGAGIFVVTGTVAKQVAGPGVVISYIFAGLAAFLSSLCYAELGSRVPRAGSAYTYTYIIIGELPAFLVGWNMILEFLIGIASVAKAWSGSVDVLTDRAITNGTAHYIGTFNVNWFDKQPDLVAVGCIIVWTIFVGAGVKISSTFNNILTSINVIILLIIISIGVYYADIKNWTNVDNGGFLPYGFSGVLAGSSSCFFAYSGFEGIATASEETKNPIKNIPIATSVSVLTVLILYVGASSALTLMMPYNLIDIVAPFPVALKYNGCAWATIIISIGAIIGLSASILGSLYALPRSVYSMSDDGLLFKPLSYIYMKTQTPIISTIIFGLITAILALFAELSLLVELLSIGTLMCYTFVSIDVILLRYQPLDMCQFHLKETTDSRDDSEKQKLMSKNHEDIGKLKTRFRSTILAKCLPESNIGPISVLSMITFCVSSWLIIFFAYDLIINKMWWIIMLLILCSIGFLSSFALLYIYEKNTSFLTFQVPFVPLLPVLSIVIDIGLMLRLNHATWLRLFIWLLIGLLIYFCYGISQSKEREKLSTTEKAVSTSENATIPSTPTENSK